MNRADSKSTPAAPRRSKLLLFANTDWYLYNFRLGLARAIRDLGHEVVLVSPSGKYGEKLMAEGFRWFPLDFHAGSRGAVSNWQLYRSVKQLYRAERPDLVHHFTIKCVLYGGIAARSLGIPAIHSVTGLGHVFTDRSLLTTLIRWGVIRLYRRACNHPLSHTIFQNEEDRQTFIQIGAVKASLTSLIRGSGADVERFQPGLEPHPRCRILFASRLLKEKGVFELVAATRKLRSEGLDFELLLAGDTYPGNPSSLTAADLDDLKSEVTFLGHVDDMPQLLRTVDIVVLPSYREGTPRVLLEAGAAGKPLIATDIAGCRGVVLPQVNGELVAVESVDELAAAMKKLILDPGLRQRYGAASREIVCEHFSEASVIARTIALYTPFLPAARPKWPGKSGRVS